MLLSVGNAGLGTLGLYQTAPRVNRERHLSQRRRFVRAVIFSCCGGDFDSGPSAVALLVRVLGGVVTMACMLFSGVSDIFRRRGALHGLSA